jgi:MFS family permease
MVQEIEEEKRKGEGRPERGHDGQDVSVLATSPTDDGGHHRRHHRHDQQNRLDDDPPEKAIDVQSVASNEEPIELLPNLEPPAHHHHHGKQHAPEEGIRWEYLTFETDIRLEELLQPYSQSPAVATVPAPNLRKFHSPLEWSSTHKTIILVLSCCCTFLAAYSAGSYSIASAPQRARWHLSSVAFNTGVTVWAVGFAISPMFLAPFSEINGRRPVFIGSAIIFLAGLIACATTPSFAGLLVARFFVGVGASTFATIIGGVLSDLYHSTERNTPMAIYSGSALAGTGMGPLCSGFIVGRTTYKWVYYHQIISLSCMLVVVCLFFKETRGSVLLSRKAKALNDYLDRVDESYKSSTTADGTGVDEKQSNTVATPKSPPPRQPIRYKVAADENRSSLTHMLYLSLTIPFKLLATEPVVFFFSLWVAFAWALLYMTFSVIPLVFTSRHGFTTEQNGAVFAAIVGGTILATVVSVYQEKLAKRRWPKITASPEGRLYFACLESALLPIGLFWFGWTTDAEISWVSPVLALACAQMGIFSIYLAVFNYLADVYHRYASSALAAQSFLRNVLAAIFPLCTDQLFRNLGYPPAASLLGGISAVLTLVPWVLVFNGERIRARSKIARQIMAHHQPPTTAS